ncbi:hypothetical protein [Longimicrobium sp.]|uniref:hypothetical protein n=1 Tax=Longimicrobium sp. TaxID=2029185 RepID=UPI002D7F80B4|nr:hypothetical protein [Longimicrobium sp.]
MAVAALAGCASGGTGGGGSYQRTTTVLSVPNGQSSADVMFDAYGGAAPVAATLAAGRDTVFAALEQAYQAVGVPVGMRDPARWTLGNRDLEISRRLGGTNLSEYFNCGAGVMGADIASTYRLQITITSTLTAQGTGTRLETVAQANARQPGTSNPPVNCASTGRLEHEINRRVGLAVGG